MLSDNGFTDFGLATLSDRYYWKTEKTPEDLFKRVSIAYGSNNAHANRIFSYMMSRWFCPATPILSNGGTDRGLPISCFLNTVSDSMEGIRNTWNENIELSRFGGGLGTYWGDVRAVGESISGSGSTSGIIPFIKVQDSLSLAISQGSLRRGSASVYLDVWHPEIEEFLEIRKPTGDVNRRSLNLHHGVNISDAFMEAVKSGSKWPLTSPKTGKTVKKVDAREIWQRILELRIETGEPYLNFIDTVNRSLPQAQKDLGLKVRQSNLCVAPETLILTDFGQQTIADMHDTWVNVWNGKEFSTVKIEKTGTAQKLIKVTLSDGSTLDCTPYHKFYKYESKQPVETRAEFLEVGDKLIKANYPVCNDFKDDWTYAYYNGFFTGDGCSTEKYDLIYFYGNKKNLAYAMYDAIWSEDDKKLTARLNKGILKKKFEVPLNCGIDTKLKWFAGLCDSDGTLTSNAGTQAIQLCNTNLEMLNNVRLMLQTLGVASKIRPAHPARFSLMPDGLGGYKEYWCQATYRLMFGETGLQKLLSLGWAPERLNPKIRTPQRDATQFVTVVSVEDHGRIGDTYCFDEPLQHMGVFNGILTGNCSEITLPTDSSRTAVCCLGSLNLAKWFEYKDEIDQVVRDCCEFLDNVLSDFISRTTIERAAYSASQERAIGLGVMGLHTFFQQNSVPFDSVMAKIWNKKIFRALRKAADKASKELANERGSCPDVPGERFSHKLAVAPTANISIICGGVSAGVEPIPANVYIHKTLSGSFVVHNPELEKILGADSDLWDDILKHDGSVQHLEILSDRDKDVFKTAFEIDQRWIVELAADRAGDICQAQSINLFLPPNIHKQLLHDLHWDSWRRGIKSLYYVRSKSIQRATNTVTDGYLNTGFKTQDEEECLSCQ